MLNCRMVDQIWEWFGAAEVDLFASQELTQCPLWFSLSHPTSIDALAHPWPDMKLYAYPPVKLISAVLCRVKTCRVRLLLVVGFPSGGRSMGDSSQEIPAMSGSGQNLAPMSRDMEVVGMADHRSPLAFDLSDEVRETINSARALSTRKIYSTKWRVFESWCLVHAVDLGNCPVGSVLVFLQHEFSAGAAATTLSVYVAAIAARRDSDDVPLGIHHLVSSFMRGTKRLRPVRPPSSPSWDISVVLNGLLEPPFEPLESAPVRILTLKVTLLVALASFKHVGDLQALSVSESCTMFAPGLVKAF